MPRKSLQTQRCIMMVLEALNGGQPLEKGPRIRLYQQLGDRLERIADRQRVNEENLIAERVQAYANQLPEMVFIE